MNIPMVTCDRLRHQLSGRLPPRILDVRTIREFEHGHIDGAMHVPIEDLEARAGELDPMVDMVVVSEHGVRSHRACEWLAGHGYIKVLNLVGGMCEYRSVGL